MLFILESANWKTTYALCAVSSIDCKTVFSSGLISAPRLVGVANPIRGVLLLRDGGEDEAPKSRMDAMEIAFAIVEVALGLPDRALIGEGTGGVPREGRSASVDFGSSGVGAGRANGGVVEKKRLFTGGDCVLVE